MENFKRALKKEAIIYFLMLLVLALIVHSDLLSDPLSRLTLMQDKGNYFHPFYWSFAIYAVIFILRKTIDFIMGLFEKKSK